MNDALIGLPIQKANILDLQQKDWEKVYTHTLAIDGVGITIHCDRCSARLTNSKIGQECPECTEKYIEFRQSPNSLEVSYFDEVIIINVESQFENP